MKLPKLPKFRLITKAELLHSSYKLGHTSYFALVFVEGHTFYAIVGGFLFLLSVADYFIHFE